MDTEKVIKDDIESRIHAKIIRMGLSAKRIDAVSRGRWLDIHLDGVPRFAVQMKVNNLGKRKFKFKDYAPSQKSN